MALAMDFSVLSCSLSLSFGLWLSIFERISMCLIFIIPHFIL